MSASSLMCIIICAVLCFDMQMNSNIIPSVGDAILGIPWHKHKLNVACYELRSFFDILIDNVNFRLGKIQIEL